MLGLQKLILRIMAVLATVALVVGLVVIAAKQYAAKEVAQAAQESINDAVSEAVAARKEAVKVDVAQAEVRAVKAQETRSVLISHREKSKEVLDVQSPDCRAADADRLRVLIEAAREVNRVVQHSTSMP